MGLNEEPGTRESDAAAEHPVEPPRTRMTRQARREQILDVASRLIQRGGLNAVTMERVAEHAGVSKRILYRHFANADELLVELLRREVLRSRSQIRESLVSNPGVASRSGLRTLFQTLTEGDPALLELLALRVSAPGPLEEAKETFFVEGEQYFTAMYREKLGLSDTSARISAAVVMAAVSGAIRSWDKGYGSPAEIESVVAAFIDGGLKNVTDMENRRLAMRSGRRSRIVR
jgi:AcrR family transcriptional regulator